MSKYPDSVSVVRGLLDVVKEEQHAKGQLSAEVLHSLYAVYGQTLISAFDLVDSEKVATVTSSCGRFLFQVTGSLGTPYYCFPNSVFCQCPAFKYCVVKRKESLMCKHVLAAWLASAMGLAEKKDVSDEYLQELLATMD